jgi:hypothetical protein
MDYRACVASNDCEDLCEGGVDGSPVVGEGGAGRSRALHQGRMARRFGRLGRGRYLRSRLRVSRKRRAFARGA